CAAPTRTARPRPMPSPRRPLHLLDRARTHRWSPTVQRFGHTSEKPTVACMAKLTSTSGDRTEEEVTAPCTRTRTAVPALAPALPSAARTAAAPAAFSARSPPCAQPSSRRLSSAPLCRYRCNLAVSRTRPSDYASDVTSRPHRSRTSTCDGAVELAPRSLLEGR